MLSTEASQSSSPRPELPTSPAHPAAPRRPRGPVRLLEATAAAAALLAVAGCSSHPTAGLAPHASSAQHTTPGVTGSPPLSAPRPSRPARRPADATAACVLFARAAADVDTTTATPGQTRQAAAHAYGTPHLQALYDGPGQGRDRELDSWQQHQARVTVTAVPVTGLDELDDADDSGTKTPQPGTPVSVTITGIARGTGGWTAPTAPYRLDCLTVQDPVAGWLVDDVAVTTLGPPTAAG